MTTIFYLLPGSKNKKNLNALEVLEGLVKQENSCANPCRVGYREGMAALLFSLVLSDGPHFRHLIPLPHLLNF